MITGLTHATLIVRDYDEALRWYTEKLGLEIRSDSPFGEGYRWVTVGVKGQDVEIVLHRPHGEQGDAGGPQAVSNVHGFVFSSDDCRRDAEELRQRGVKIAQGPEEVMWGVQAVFEDLYGNTHVLVEPIPHTPPQGG